MSVEDKFVKRSCPFWLTQSIHAGQWDALKGLFERQGCSPNASYTDHSAVKKSLFVCTTIRDSSHSEGTKQFCRKIVLSNGLPMLHYLILAEADKGGNNSKRSFVDGAKILLDNGARVDRKNPVTGDTALHVAAAHCRLHFINFLLSRGAPYKVENAEGKRPFDLLPTWCPINAQPEESR